MTTLRVTRLSAVRAQSVRWLWPARIPCGKLTILAGMQGLGKSMVMLDVAARITTGATFHDLPEWVNPAGDVLILPLEDGLADVVRPRVDAAGGDCNRVEVIHGAENARGGVDHFDLGRHVDLLAGLLAERSGVRLVLLDPLTGYLGAGRNENREADVRASLQPLVDLAESTGVAIVGIMHVGKSDRRSPLHRVLGSTAFTAVARSVLMIGPHPEDPDARVLVSAKSSLSRRAPSTWFRIAEPGRIEWLPGDPGVTAEEAFPHEEDRRKNRSAPKLEKCVEFLRATLISAGGAMDGNQLNAAALGAGHSERTIKRARVAAGIVGDNGGEVGAKWVARLSAD